MARFWWVAYLASRKLVLRRCSETSYRAMSWSKHCRVAARIEAVVTSLATGSVEWVYRTPGEFDPGVTLSNGASASPQASPVNQNRFPHDEIGASEARGQNS